MGVHVLLVECAGQAQELGHAPPRPMWLGACLYALQLAERLSVWRTSERRGGYEQCRRARPEAELRQFRDGRFAARRDQSAECKILSAQDRKALLVLVDTFYVKRSRDEQRIENYSLPALASAR